MMPFRHDYYTCLDIVVSDITVLVIATFGQFGVSDPGNWFDSSVNVKKNFLLNGIPVAGTTPYILYTVYVHQFSVLCFCMYRDLVVKTLAIHHWVRIDLHKIICFVILRQTSKYNKKNITLSKKPHGN